MKKDLFELYQDYLKYAEEKTNLNNEIELLKKKHQKELLELDKKLKELEKSQYKKDFIKELKGDDSFSYSTLSLNLTSSLEYGQKVSSFDYFKKLLEEKIGQELVLVEYITKHKKVFEEWDEYEMYKVKKTMVDCLFVPKKKQDQLEFNFNKLDMERYINVIKKLPNVFLIERMWKEGECKQGMKPYQKPYKRFYIYFNYFDGKKGLFFNDDYGKDLEYDKIILKTYDYCQKSEKLAQQLYEQDQIKKQLKKHKELQNQLLEQQKKIKNSQKQLKNYNLDEEITK